jgi:hypothetical protein
MVACILESQVVDMPSSAIQPIRIQQRVSSARRHMHITSAVVSHQRTTRTGPVPAADLLVPII